MKRFCIALFLIVLVTGRAPAQSAPPSKAATEKTPTPEKLLDAYVEALGGAARIHQVTSRVMKGKFELPAMSLIGTAEVYLAAPDRFFSLVRVPDVGDFLQGFDGQVGWSVNPQDGLKDITGEELAQLRRHSQFYHDLRIRELYTELHVTGKAKAGERDAWVLEAKPPEGAPEKFYFDAKSSLLLRHDSVQITPDGPIPVEQYYEEYSTVDGIQVPTLLRHVDRDNIWTVKFTEISHNVPVEPSKFAKPTAQ